MQLVIEISDGLYNNLDTIKNGSIASKIILDCVRKGQVLPKGHSELVYREDVCNELRYMDNNGCITRSVNHVIEDIKKGVPTIVEADKEEK